LAEARELGRHAVKDWHVSPNEVDGSKLKAGSVDADRLKDNAIFLRFPLLTLPPISGIDAATTGVKVSAVRIPFSSKHVDKLVLLCECAAITAGATVRVGIYNVTAGAYVCYNDFTAADEAEVTAVTLPSDGDVLELRIECTVAVAGGTFDLNYALAFVEVGVS